MTGSASDMTTSVIEALGSPRQGFRARLGAKIKQMLEWIGDRLSFFLR
jgi:hypothetical protein